MRAVFIIAAILAFVCGTAQTAIFSKPTGNLRLSFLVFPPIGRLLTAEVALYKKCSIQLETNFVNTHGINFKYYVLENMNKTFLFVGIAFIENDYLRKDKMTTYLPDAGFGYAHRFGKFKEWLFDSRLGIGSTINADKHNSYPVLKTGIGLTF